MKKLFKNCAMLMLGLSLLGGYSAANAAEIELDKMYDVTADSPLQGTFTPSTSGTLSVSYFEDGSPLVMDCWSSVLATDANYSNWIEVSSSSAGVSNYTVTAGTTYYVKAAVSTGMFGASDGEPQSFPFGIKFSMEGGSSGGTGGGSTDVTAIPLTGAEYYIQDTFLGTITTTSATTATLYWKDWGGYMPSEVIYTDQAYTNVVEYSKVDWTDAGVVYQEYDLKANTTYYVKVWVDSNGAFGSNSATPFTLQFAFGDGGNTGGGDDTPADIPEGWTAATIGQTYTIASGGSLKLYFSPETDGVLKLNQWGETDNFLRTQAPADNNFDGDFVPNAEYTGSDPAQYTYTLKGGQNYFYYAVNIGNAVPYVAVNKVEFVSFTSDGGNDNPGGGGNQPGELPEGYSAMEMKSYSVTGVGSVMLAFTPDTSGKLTVTQTGSYDSHLFKAAPAYSTEYGYDNNYDILIKPQNGYENETSATTFPLEYGVAGGVTYYFVAKLMAGDPISAVSFAFEAASTGNIIELNTPYVVNESDPVYTFTHDESGYLYVQWSNPNEKGDDAYNTGIIQGYSQFFFYEDYALTIPVGVYSSGDGQGGWLITFYIEADKTYYFHAPVSGYQVEFTFEEGVGDAAIVSVNPTPGTAYDVANYRYHMNLTTTPATTTVGKVKLSYVPAGQTQPTTIEMSGTPDASTGDLQIPVDDLVTRIENNEIEPETEILIILEDLKAGGNYVTKNSLVLGDDYVDIGENGLVTITYVNGTPIVAESTSFPKQWKKAWARQDEAGIATMVFDGNVQNVGAVNVMAGHQIYGSEGGEAGVYTVVVPNQNVKYENNTVTIDFTNIDYNMPEGTSEVTVMVMGVLGANGLYADFDGSSVYQYYAPYESTGADLGDKLVSSILPAPEADVPGFGEGELLEMMLFESVMDQDPTAVKAVLLDPEGEQIYAMDFEYRMMTNSYIYEFPDDMEYLHLYKGNEYQFVVTVYGADNKVIGTETIYWFGSSEFVGVNSFEAENGVNVIYTLSGVRVNTSDVNALSNGLYIINGKKVLIRK